MELLRFRAIMLALPLLAPFIAGSADKAKDRLSLAAQPHVYLIYQATKKQFVVESNPFGFIQNADFWRNLDLEDPAGHGVVRLAERLRAELSLTNLAVRRVPSDQAVIREDVEAAQASPGSPGYSAQGVASAVEAADTFQKRNPSGVVIEMVTQHWGIDERFNAKYYADFRVINLADSKILSRARCSWIVLDFLDTKKLAAANRNFELNGAQLGQRISADNGALLKASLRKAAEQCIDKVAPRFL